MVPLQNWGTWVVLLYISCPATPVGLVQPLPPPPEQPVPPLVPALNATMSATQASFGLVHVVA
jgi:hypothetical protein